MAGWLACARLCGCTDDWRAGSVKIKMTDFLQDREESETTMNVYNVPRKLKRNRVTADVSGRFLCRLWCFSFCFSNYFLFLFIISEIICYFIETSEKQNTKNRLEDHVAQGPLFIDVMVSLC